MSLWRSSMTVFDSQFKVMILSLKSMLGMGWIMAGMAGRIFDQRTWRLVSCVSFFKSRRFISWRHMVPREVARQFKHGAFNAREQVPSSLGYATFCLTQIATVGSNFWKGHLSQLSILPLSPNYWFPLNAIQQPRFNYPWAYKMGNFSVFPSFPLFHSLSSSKPILSLFLPEPSFLKLFLLWTFVAVNFRQNSGGITIPRNTKRSRN